MGLPRAWMRIAEAIGVDAFLTTWKFLDAEYGDVQPGEVLRIHLRRYRSYLRYQRNRVIEAQYASGKNSMEIKKHLRASLGEDVSRAHILRIARRK